MDAFAQPLPGLVFFELVLHAPPEELAEINRLATVASMPYTEGGHRGPHQHAEWIGDFAEKRRRRAPAATSSTPS